MPYELSQHPLRQRLNDEVHTRPPIPLLAPALISYFAVIHEPEGRASERTHLGLLYERLGLPVEPSAEATHLIIDCGDFQLKWELHGEFSTYTFFSTPKLSPQSGETALDLVPSEWLHAIPGQVIAASHIELLAAGSITPEEMVAARSNAIDTNIISLIAGQAAWLFTDFRIQEGFSRFTLIDESMGRLRTGRIVQRILEIETYRVMARLAFPSAKSVSR